MPDAVVVGVDGSEPSTAAAEWAAQEAYRSGRPLRLLHAGDAGSPAPGEADRGDEPLPPSVLATRDHIASVLPGLELTCEHVPGSPADALVAAGGRNGLLVLGSRGLGGFAGLLVGSVSLRVVGHANCPVVVVRAGADGQGGGEDVVLGLDSDQACPDVIAFAFEQAAARGATLRVLESRKVPAGPYSAEGVVYQPEVREALEAGELMRLQEALAPWREKHPEVRVQAELAAWSAGRALVEASRSARLTVVGRRRPRLHPAAPWLGSVAHAVLHHAHSPVAVVPHD
ncbi:universal stress protein [Streptomyces sp. LS1784]|uniref:universal stress protein n=1 Tax=Streptomyces sp. LS1784 TaxID=2851533 RepID=UPI001CCF578C|nr:universal stress protein [Streptomyces sp. LS1784]